MTKEYNAFKGLNLSDTRSENETREEYKKRLKQNGQVMKLYFKVGREAFQQMFPEGITYDMFKAPKTTIEKVPKKNAKRLGEAK